MMLLRVRSLALGHSGVRPLVAAGAGRPAQPRHHAVGAGARLARRLRRPGPAGPLRAGAARRGLGARQGRRPGRRRPRRCTAAGLRPIELAAKEGLALINGTDGMLGMLLLAIADARHLFTMADVTAALAIEAMLGSDRPFLPELHAIRPHPGQAVVGGQHPPAAAGLRHHGLAPRRPDARRAGRLLDALRPAGGRRGPGHARLRRARSPSGSCVRRGQPGGAARRPGRVDRQLPRRAARLRRRLPGHRRRRGRRDLRAAGRPAARRDPLPGPAARSSPPTRASTPA